MPIKMPLQCVSRSHRDQAPMNDLMCPRNSLKTDGERERARTTGWLRVNVFHGKTCSSYISIVFFVNILAVLLLGDLLE